MDLTTRLQNVAVLGAGGKMGSGISLLLAVEMTRRKLSPQGKGLPFRLNLIDTSEAALDGLQGYLRSQALKVAEKSIVELRGFYADRPDLVENGEIIQAFLEELAGLVRLSTSLEAARGAHLVFEAIIEDEAIKRRVYSSLRELCSPETFFLSNTSSIPIHLIDETAGLEGRYIGFHFYNPPPVQKLVEVIASPATRLELSALAQELGAALRKKLIPSRDVAGFIGNGHFTRDGLHAIGEVERLAAEHPFVEAVYMVNRVSQDFLIRPMGIFQLIDYVGIDVFRSILEVMNRHIPGAGLHSALVDRMVAAGVRGGQFSSGAQKDGFLKYGKGGPEGIYDLAKGGYTALEPQGWCQALDEKLGPLPAGWKPWRAMAGDPARAQARAAYFGALAGMDGRGARLARAYLERSRAIGLGLVEDGVAACAEDVNGVLENGFYHLYGPVNDYAKE